jgi:CRP-like cAMP-binding protein
LLDPFDTQGQKINASSFRRWLKPLARFFLTESSSYSHIATRGEGGKMSIRSETIKAVKNALLLKGLSQEQITKLAEIWDEESFGSGGMIIRAGDVIRNVYLIVRGTCDIELQVSGTLEPLVVDSLKKNDVFGEMCFLDGKPKSARILCKEPTTVLRMRAEDFEKLRKDRPDITEAIIRNMALILVKKIRKSNAAIKKAYLQGSATTE